MPRKRNAYTALLAACQDVDLRVTQALLASRIGKKKDRTEFLRGELERIRSVVREAVVKAEGDT